MLTSTQKYIVYKTTNKVNGKFYIGVHKTNKENDFDGYYGSGTLLKKAIKKYGKHNFCRETIYFCDSYDEAYSKEKELVSQELIESNQCYNSRLGGEGGTSPNLEVRKSMSEARKGKYTKESNHFFNKKHSNETRKILSDKAKTRFADPKNNPMYGKNHTDETKQKLSEMRKRISYEERYGIERANEIRKKASLKLSGKNNPNYGKSGMPGDLNPMKREDVKQKHLESMKKRYLFTCPHCNKVMNAGGETVHRKALAKKGIVI